MTYMRNTDVVRQFKKRLVKAFYEMREHLLLESGERRQVDVNFNHTRGITNHLGLDIRYTMDLTKIAMKPTPVSLDILQRVTGVDLQDIIDRLPVTGGVAASVAKFVKANICEAPGERVEIRRVYAAYLSFCSESGESPLAAMRFGRELRQLCPGITTLKSLANETGERVNCYGNIAIVITTDLE